MITKIKNLFRERKKITLYDLSLIFEMDTKAMEKMLEILIDKGFITKKDINCEMNFCRGCSQPCDPSRNIFYELNSEAK